MRQVDVVIIGGGSAGMAAAVAAREHGAHDVLILERADALGGILRQCIHNGFGLHRFGEDLTGVEYAKRYANMVEKLDIPCLLHTFVLNISESLVVTAMNPEEGLFDIPAKAVVLAMGCRERSRGALMIPGMRCAGIFTAGTAQKYLNIDGYLPGKRIVILGSGDIGLIMARQFTLEGAKVEAVVEILPHSSGLARNISQCLEDYDIPLYYNSTVTNIFGGGRVYAVEISDVDTDRNPIDGTQRRVPCDTLLLSAGLIPENELTREAGIALSVSTKGAVVSDDLQTSHPGVFSCGNVLHVHDLVDHVSREGETAGFYAARFAASPSDSTDNGGRIAVSDGFGVTGTVPHWIRRRGETDTVRLTFRPTQIFKNCALGIVADGQTILRSKRLVLAPGEMGEITIHRKLLADKHSGISLHVEV